MRSDVTSMTAVLEGFASRTSTSDGRAAERRPVPFPDAVPVEPDPAADDLRPVHDLRDTLRRRRSSLRYAPEPVRTGLILSLLGEVVRRDRDDWGLDAAAGPLEGFVFALRSEDEAPGLYRVTAEGSWHLAGLDALGPVENLGVQREFSTAAGIVALYANLDQADTWAGAHGYRVSASRVAMATYDLNFRIQALGLVGTLFGGFIPSSVHRLVHSDGASRHSLLATTYARPVQD
ncbi:tpaF [Streptomyces sp. Je 1-79]|uniref:tpaF n=1 Tax=Streptomyces sp. Je 1-79 TaxID=2943847 RepID=UPI0021A2A2E2|nr:tpaF [Streptomyces sp. Je 1-79]MCT4355821.1 tpaF [Streptomyces sp. Je 1-79]